MLRRIIQNNDSTRMPSIALFPWSCGVSEGVEVESWFWNENLKMFRRVSLATSSASARRFRRSWERLQFVEMMSNVIVLSVLFFCSFTRFKWLQFFVEIVSDSSFSFILKFAVLLLQCLMSLPASSLSSKIHWLIERLSPLSFFLLTERP